MRQFHVQERDASWPATAPIQIKRRLRVPAPQGAVFSVLADLSSWSEWFTGMRRVRIDRPSQGVDALRTVWIGATRVQERFLIFDPDSRLTFAIVGSNLPGLSAMVEDWRLSPAGSETELDIVIGVEAKGPLRWLPGLVRFAVARSTRGATDSVAHFAREQSA
jgi:carbon monoxide dehydrogenase subunit G